MQQKDYGAPVGLQYGGGLSESLLHPVVAVAMILAIILIFLLPRKYAAVPFLLVVFLTPLEQQLYIGGVHVFVMRILILAGCVRIAGDEAAIPDQLVRRRIHFGGCLLCCVGIDEGSGFGSYLPWRPGQYNQPMRFSLGRAGRLFPSAILDSRCGRREARVIKTSSRRRNDSSRNHVERKIAESKCFWIPWRGPGLVPICGTAPSVRKDHFRTRSWREFLPPPCCRCSFGYGKATGPGLPALPVRSARP